MQVAVQDDLLLLHKGGFRGQYLDLDLAYRRIRGIRASRVRMNVLWANAVHPAQRELTREPRRVVYNWDLYDEAIRNARRRGLKVHLALTGPAPAYATPTNTSSRGYVRPNPRKYRRFVATVADRYRGQVDRFSIWNEPNWFTWLAPLRRAPLIYRKLYMHGRRAIKNQAPRAEVLLGELVPYSQRGRAMAPLRFLREMTCLGRSYRKKRRLTRRHCRRTLRAEGVAHHPYDFTRAPGKKRRGRDNVTIASLGRMVRALNKMHRQRVLLPRGSKKMPLHLTEYGYYRSGRRAVPERRRARWLTRAFTRALKHPRVLTMLQYIVVEPPGGTNFNLSIVNTDGSTTRSWKRLKRWAVYRDRKNHIQDPWRWRAG